MQKIGVFIECKKEKITAVSLELISELKRIKPRYFVEAVLLCEKVSDHILNSIKSVGADSIISLEGKCFKDYDTHYYSEAVISVIKSENYAVFLIGSTLIGRDLGPRISALVHTGLTADATILDFEENDGNIILLATRPALGGNLFATILCPNHTPQMATVRPGVFPLVIQENIREIPVKIENYSPSSNSKVRIIEHKVSEEKRVDITKSQVLISGGRGVIKQFDQLAEIASVVGGEVSATRAVVEAKVQPIQRLVGQTGSTVRPLVYVAFGISGAVQHVAGMENSELIIAINSDPKAPIFDVADVSIVGDAQKIIPEVIKLLKERKQVIIEENRF